MEDLERSYLEAPLNQGLLDINRIKFSLKQLEFDYLLFEQERRNFFYSQDEQHSLQEQFFQRKQSIRELHKEVYRVCVPSEEVGNEQLEQEQSICELLTEEQLEKTGFEQVEPIPEARPLEQEVQYVKSVSTQIKSVSSLLPSEVKTTQPNRK